MRKLYLTILTFLGLISLGFGQPVPGIAENIPYLVTFSNDAGLKWGDDDYVQVFFFVVPETHIQPVFFRVFDPDVSGKVDEMKGGANSQTRFSVYGGNGCITYKDAKNIDPDGNYKSGNLLATKTFGVDKNVDNSWYSFGPFNPSEGELNKEYGGYIFKIITEGLDGDDGNLYKFFMSSKVNDNKEIEGGNCFTFEYSFRLSDDPNQVAHIYPYIDNEVISVKQSNFDWDFDGYIRIISKVKKGELVKASGDKVWASGIHNITKNEHNSSLDIQFIKDKKIPKKNNNVVFYVTNQYGKFLPFYTVPIGGIPKPEFNIGIVPKK